MKTWIGYFLGLGVFELVVGVVYWLVTNEAAGTVLFLTVGLTPLVIGGYALGSGYLRDPLPQDDPQADPADSAGDEVGAFSSGTGWPLVLALGVIVLGASLVYGTVLMPIGVALIGWAMLGLVRESAS
jgi:hypothetical protein